MPDLRLRGHLRPEQRPYAVLDQDRSAASTTCWRRSTAPGVFHRVAQLRDAGRHQAGDRPADRAPCRCQIGQDFQRRLAAGLPADVQVIADGRNSNTAGTALGYVGAIVDGFNANWAADHGGAAPPLQVSMRAWYNANLETRWYMIPALIGTLTFLQTLLLTAMSVAREREQGTFDQLLVTPFRPFEIMVGKALPSVLIGTHSGDADPAGGAALVSHSVRRLVSHALCRPVLVPACRRRHGADVVGGRRHHAAGDALRLRHHDAVRAALRADDAVEQHAGHFPGLHVDAIPFATRSILRTGFTSKAPD